METDTGTGPEYWALVKGAPEVVEGFLSEAPAGYVATYKRFASQGGRCLYTQTWFWLPHILQCTGRMSMCMLLLLSLIYICFTDQCSHAMYSGIQSYTVYTTWQTFMQYLVSVMTSKIMHQWTGWLPWRISALAMVWAQWSCAKCGDLTWSALWILLALQYFRWSVVDNVCSFNWLLWLASIALAGHDSSCACCKCCARACRAMGIQERSSLKCSAHP